jgi:hypothetical protein
VRSGSLASSLVDSRMLCLRATPSAAIHLPLGRLWHPSTASFVGCQSLVASTGEEAICIMSSESSDEVQHPRGLSGRVRLGSATQQPLFFTPPVTLK